MMMAEEARINCENDDMSHLLSLPVPKEELIEKIRKLQVHVKQLRNIIQKSGSADSINEGPQPKRSRRKERPFDFKMHTKRHVALKFAYLGWNYQGLALACQEDLTETIETYLFNALKISKTKLIETREGSNYHRCGRTDKGVSAFSQVISINLRSKLKQESISLDNSDEIDYCRILNNVLPQEIRVIAWSPVRSDFSARFDCKHRTYRYYFPTGSLDLEKMREAAGYLVGSHDFRNFCKLDPNGLKPTTRNILSVQIERISSPDSGYEMGVFIINGSSFIWHQIRCIAAVLLLVGKGLESPLLVPQLLNIKEHPKKPQYSIAVDFPLVLFDVNHGEELKWKYDLENLRHVIMTYQKLWTSYSVKSVMIRDMTRSLEAENTEEENRDSGINHLDCLIMGSTSRVYQPLLQRPICERESLL